MAYNVTEQHIDADVEDENSLMNHNMVNDDGTFDEESKCDKNFANEFVLVGKDRLHFIGNDRSKGKRIWVQTAHDPTKYNLYAFDGEIDGVEYYKCIQCTRYAHRHHITSLIKICKIENEDSEIWEKKNHYPSCNLDKSHIDKIQNKYHRSSFQVVHANPALRRASFGSLRAPKKSTAPSSSRPLKKRGSKNLTPKASNKTEEPFNSNSNMVDVSNIVSGAFSVSRRTQQRSRTQGVSLIATLNRGFTRQDSVASTFSHLVSSFKTNTATVAGSSPNNNVASSSSTTTKRQSTASLRNSRATTVPPKINAPTSSSGQRPSRLTQKSEIQRFKPKTLSVNESLYHCVPSTHDLREMLAILGIEFHPTCQKFWHSSYIVNEIHGQSMPITLQQMGPERNYGYPAFCLFLTSSEDAALKIQEFVKRYIYKNYFNSAAQELESYNSLMKSALCSFNLEDIHLWVLAKILNVRIVIFDEEETVVFGDTFNNSIPSILLKRIDEAFYPVLDVDNDIYLSRGRF